jgi:hypothetical protein
MKMVPVGPVIKYLGRDSLLILALCVSLDMHGAQAPSATTPVPPDWALPGSSNHRQVPPPEGFHRPSTNFNKSIGIFKGQSDVGSALVRGSASYDRVTKQYTITSAGYNVWYTRDEFRYLWKKMSGDVSLAADVSFVDPKGFFDRKIVLIVRQNLDDDSEEAMVGEHGSGLVHLAYRPVQNTSIKEIYRINPHSGVPHAKRIGIEKHGDTFTIFVSMTGEPMHQVGPPLRLHFDAPFYVGIGFCSHLPVTLDTSLVSNLVLKNSAGKAR